MNLVNLRNFLGVTTKLEESIFKNNNQIKSTVTTRSWVLSTWTKAWPVTGLVSRRKDNGSPHSFKSYGMSFRVRGYCNVLTKMEAMSFLVFWRHIVNAIFLKYSKEGRLSSNHVGIQNIPSEVCYGVTKHYQVQSEHRRTQSPLKHLRWSVFAQTVNTLKSWTGYAKKLHLRCLKGFWICLCCKTRQV